MKLFSKKPKPIVLSRSVKAALNFAEEVAELWAGHGVRFYDCTLTTGPFKHAYKYDPNTFHPYEFGRTVAVDARFFQKILNENKREDRDIQMHIQIVVFSHKIDDGEDTVNDYAFVNQVLKCKIRDTECRIRWSGGRPGLQTFCDSGWVIYKV